MKKFNLLFTMTLLIIAGVFVAANLLLNGSSQDASGRPYRVEVNRLCHTIENGEEPDVSVCKYVTAVEKYDSQSDFFDPNNDYMIKSVNGELYRFEYIHSPESFNRVRTIMNVFLGIMSLTVLAILIFIRTRLLKPFNKLSSVPYDLSKGNLAQPLEENKSRYFGKFVWGVNMLRESISRQKAHELELLKEKQTMILSISHDIKTPLSAIKLYSKAMSKGLYTDREKITEAARNIDRNADDIERFVTQLTSSANEDFIQLDVKDEEFYLSQLLTTITEHYSERFADSGTEFTVEDTRDCLICGDCERSVEVLQNLIENAIKYGDGKYIRITVTEEDGCKLVCVANSGCTLRQGELVHIFDSFWRGSNSQHKEGSGLGLYICRQLMLKMNGEIFAQTDGDEMRITAVFPKA